MSTYKLPDNKIPDHLRNVVDTIQEILVEEALDFLLIGATARDIIMHGQYDLGISVIVDTRFRSKLCTRGFTQS